MKANIALLASALLLITSLGCESPPSNTKENIGSATTHDRAIMLGERYGPDGEPIEPLSMPGATADIVLENYKENQSLESQRELREDSGIVDLRN